MYLVEAVSVLVRRWSFTQRHLSYYLLLADVRLRRSVLGSSLTLNDFDLVICAHPNDAALLTVDTSTPTFYDCPNPWTDELRDEGRLTDRQASKLQRFESELYERVDHLSFSWVSYARHVLASDGYDVSGRNITQLNWGCDPAPQRAEFRDPPRVIYLGSLSSKFIDIELLGRLSKSYPHIDVYGGPPPDPSLGLNYLGWAPPTVLQQYQFGLITCTKDEMRRNGFSAKHLDYIAYGLPVLVPAWRRHLDLLRGSLPYEEETFTSVIAALGSEDAWRQASDEAYEQALELTWDNTLRPLGELLD